MSDRRHKYKDERYKSRQRSRDRNFLTRSPSHSRRSKEKYTSTSSRNYRRSHSPNDEQPNSQQNELNITNLVNFSFFDYKSELSKVLLGFIARDKIVDDVKDFWLFLHKYENLLKHNGQSILPEPPPTDCSFADKSNSTGYNKSFNINLSLAIPFRDLYGRISTYTQSTKLTEYRVRQFLQIVVHYLDFRQKEKFMKLRNLRKAQTDLPVAKYKTEIIAAVRNEQVVLIAGDTGCGKSTQIPQYLYEAGYESLCCTQPRRIACISLSKRVAHEMLCEYGTEVGYQIRFERSKNKNTKIVFITEGLLLRQLSTEAALSQYDVIVLDEIHERHLHGDFLLGITKCLLRTRSELKLVLMSATINVKLFSDYFRDEKAHVIEVPGRLYPIKMHYMPQIQDFGGPQKKTERLSPEPYIQIMQLIDNKYPSEIIDNN